MRSHWTACSIRGSLRPYVRPLRIMQNRRKTLTTVRNTLWSYAYPLQTHLFARPGFFLQSLSELDRELKKKLLQEYKRNLLCP